jgi:predicted PurR-regulated permease PerM
VNLPLRTDIEIQVVAMTRWLLIAALVVIGYFIVQWAAGVLGPVLVALGIAYLLAPVTQRLVHWGMSRTVAAGSLLLLFVAILIGAIVIVVPRVASDISDLIKDLPRIIDNLSAWMALHLGIELPSDWRSYLQSEEAKAALSKAAGPMHSLASAALGGVLQLLGFLAELLLVPVFAFYFLADWDQLLKKIQHLIPPRRRARAIELAHDINRVVAGWVRGQGIVTMMLAVLYAIAFSIAGVPGALPLGIVVGGLTVVPFVGTLVGAMLTLGMTLAGGSSSTVVLSATIIFVAFHLLESMFLTPKIVGHRVGLSESAALFAVVAGGKLLGFVGVVLAVPLAATVAVLLRRAVKYYEHTAFFGDEADADVVVPTAMDVVMPAIPATPAPGDPVDG